MSTNLEKLLRKELAEYSLKNTVFEETERRKSTNKSQDRLEKSSNLDTLK